MQSVRTVPKWCMEFMWQHGMPPLRQPTYGNHQGVGYVHTKNTYRTPQTTVWATALDECLACKAWEHRALPDSNRCQLP